MGASVKRMRLAPPGEVRAFAGATAPAGFLLCNGAAVSRAAYGALYAAIGTAYGVGDGATTFNLPDMRGRVPVGVDAGAGRVGAAWGSTLGQGGGEEKHVQAAAEIGVHKHGGIHSTFGFSTGSQYYPIMDAGSSNTAGTTSPVTNTGSSTAANVMQPGQTVNYMIKY
jgi:microcystin-dependent protein